jgi:hypothetical protein
VNSRGSPCRTFLHHPPDENANISIDIGPAEAFAARSETPEQTKACTVPGNNSFRFDDNQDVAP